MPIISLALTWTSSEEPWTSSSSPKSTSNFPNLRSGKEKINWKTFSIDSWSSLQGLLNKFLDYTRISLIIITFCLHLKQTFNKPWYNFQFHHLSWTVKSNYFCLLWYTNSHLHVDWWHCYITNVHSVKHPSVYHIYIIGKKHVQVIAVQGFKWLSFKELKKIHMAFNIFQSELNQNGRRASVEWWKIVPWSLLLLGCNRQTFLESVI